MKKIILIFFLIIIIKSDIVYSTIKSFTASGTTGFYSNPLNWTPFGVPGNGDEVLFPAGYAICLVSSSTADLESFKIIGGSVLQSSGTRIKCKSFFMTSASNSFLSSGEVEIYSTSGSISGQFIFFNDLRINGVVNLGNNSITYVNNIFFTTGLLFINSNELVVKGLIGLGGNLLGGSTSTLTILDYATPLFLPSITLKKLTVGRVSGVVLGGNVLITDELKFSNGKITLGPFNLFVQGTITGHSNSKYIITNSSGTLTRNLLIFGLSDFPKTSILLESC